MKVVYDKELHAYRFAEELPGSIIIPYVLVIGAPSAFIEDCDTVEVHATTERNARIIGREILETHGIYSGCKIRATIAPKTGAYKWKGFVR